MEDAARRELMKEAGVAAPKLTLLGVYSAPERDPRGHTVSVVYWGRARSLAAVAGDDAADVEWVAGWRKATLAFDHAKILGDAAKAAGKRTRSVEATRRWLT